MVIKCEICCINDAQVKDYRNLGLNYDKYLVCQNCFWLNDIWFLRLKNAKEGVAKKRILAQFTEGLWKDYLMN